MISLAQGAGRLHAYARIRLEFARVYLRSLLHADRTLRRALPGPAEPLAELAALALFVGHPRSGSTLLGSLLDAHPDVCMATELDCLLHVRLGTSPKRLAAAIVDRAQRFVTHDDSRWEGYSFAVPGACQGKLRRARVLGDKKAGVTVRRLVRDPGLLDSLDAMFEAPVKLIYVVRNPLDNISTRWRKSLRRVGSYDMNQAMDEYFDRHRAIESLLRTRASEHVLVVHHERLIEAPRETLETVHRFLGVDPAEGFLDRCAALVERRPRRSRRTVSWDADQLQAIVARVSSNEILAAYADDAEAGQAR